MATVELKLPSARYEILIEPGLLARAGAVIKSVAPHARAAVFADAAVVPAHAPALKNSLESAGYRVLQHTLISGEEQKNLDTTAKLYGVVTDARLERKSPIIALGGGVAGDMTGFVAATYLRGVPFVQCPTTLLAMVDASVGGKVGVNLPQGKNLVGAFYQPRVVIIDTDTLKTLPPRELRCGLAECVKHGVIRDAGRFEWLEKNLDRVMKLDPAALVELVEWNVRIKANVVMADEKETGERAHLNFGHTFGHAIEAISGYGDRGGFHHGEAVSIGMVAATRLAADAGRCPRELVDRLVRLLDRIGLPTRAKLPPTDKLIEAMWLDKKVAGDRMRLILPDRLGAVTMTGDADDAAIAKAWATVRE